MGTADARRRAGRVYLENRTPCVVELDAFGVLGSPLVLAPLETRAVAAARAPAALEEQLGDDPRVRARWHAPISTLAWRLLAAVVRSAIGAVEGRRWARGNQAAGPDGNGLVTGTTGGQGVRAAWSTLREHLQQRSGNLAWRVSVAVVVLAGAGVPAVLIWISTDFSAVLGSVGSVREAVNTTAGFALAARVCQWLAMSLFALAPVMLWFAFERQWLAPARRSFLMALFQLFPDRLRTVDEIQARHGSEIAAAFGEVRCAGDRLAVPRRSPLVLVTIVFAVGWALTLLNPQASSMAVADDLAGAFSLLEPTRSPIAFGFAGAYLSTLAAVARGYTRGDLGLRTYTRALPRFLVVTLLALLLHLFPQPGHPLLLITAFAAGAFPVWGQRLVLDQLREWSGRRAGPLQLREGTPLTALEEIDVHERSVLAGVGVLSVEALAHCDLVHLLLATGLPPDRVVDWVDQALLHLYTSDAREGEIPPASDFHARLRDSGIRTASDYRRVYAVHLCPPPNGGRRSAAEAGGPEGLRHALACGASFSHQCSEGVLARLDLLMTALDGERWMGPIDAWHDHQHARLPVLRIPVAATNGKSSPSDGDISLEAPAEVVASAPAGQPTSRTMPNLSS